MTILPSNARTLGGPVGAIGAGLVARATSVLSLYQQTLRTPP